MYLINNIDFKEAEDLEGRLRNAVLKNFYISLPFLACFLVMILFIKGYAVNEAGQVELVAGKYLTNLLELPALAGSLVIGLVMVIAGVLMTAKTAKRSGIWFAGFGSFLVGMTVFGLAGFNNTAFYPSKADLQSSLTIYNASSTLFTLQTMTWVALAIPFVLAYIAYVWRAMDGKKLSIGELTGTEAGESY